MKELILGGARSGKSTLAESRAQESGMTVIYVATATAGDEEMTRRIAHHQSKRPQAWRLIEEPLRLVDVLEQQAAPGHCLLVDCLTLWLSNLLALDEGDNADGVKRYQTEIDRLVDTLPDLDGRIILVTNEVGQGVVPVGELARQFIDEAGRLHQRLARICDRVTLTVAGLPLTLKESK